MNEPHCNTNLGKGFHFNILETIGVDRRRFSGVKEVSWRLGGNSVREIEKEEKKEELQRITKE